jgi:outer membrane lipoprotein-sorting protein
MRRASALGALVLAFAGCPHALPPVERPYPPPTLEELVASLRARAAHISAIDASAKAEESAPHATRVRVKVQLYAQRPDRLRLEIDAPIGGGAATLVTDGERFQLFDARQGRYLTGAAEPCNVARLIQVELPPRAIVDALLGSIPIDGVPADPGWDKHDGGREVFSLRGEDGAETRVWLDGRGKSWDPVRAERREGGRLVWRLSHSDFADHEGVRLPGQTTVDDLLHGSTVKLRYREQHVNPELPATGFHLEPPANLPAERVDCR